MQTTQANVRPQTTAPRNDQQEQLRARLLQLILKNEAQRKAASA